VTGKPHRRSLHSLRYDNILFVLNNATKPIL
jgi:hypothetical protein